MSAHVVVVGSINQDLFVEVLRFPQKGETLTGSNLRKSLGGKGANQAVAAARAGAPTTFIGATGDDATGEDLRQFLASESIDTSQLQKIPATPTGTALITVDANGENQIIVVAGANAALTPATTNTNNITANDIVVCQMEIPLDVIEATFCHAKKQGAQTILNAAPARPLPTALGDQMDILIVNETELAELSGLAFENGPNAAAHLNEAFAKLCPHAQTLIVTLGAKGVIALHQNQIVFVEGHPAPVVDTTGAGDCFVGYLAAALSKGTNLKEALTLANQAASLSVGRKGAATSVPHLAAVTSAQNS